MLDQDNLKVFEKMGIPKNTPLDVLFGDDLFCEEIEKEYKGEVEEVI